MNNDDVTSLLERLVADRSVSPAPLAELVHQGRRRMRVRRGLHVGGSASAVAIIAIGGSILWPSGHSGMPAAGDGSVTPTTGSHSSPLQAPTSSFDRLRADQLLGDWYLLGTSPARHGRPLSDPHHLSFQMLGHRLTWQGYDGCNWTSGDVILGKDGVFRTANNATTLVGCLPGPPSSEQRAVRVLESAARADLRSSRLTIYDKSGHRLGVIYRYQPTQAPPTPTHSWPAPTPTN